MFIMAFLWIRLVFCSILIALALSTEDTLEVEADPELADYLREAIENFRSQMTKGIPEINMPVLDPLHLEDMDIDVNENVATMHLHINELNIKDLSTFTIHEIVPNMEEFYISLDLSLPTAKAHGRYILTGKMVKIFPLCGKGDFEINITNARISGESKLQRTDDTILMEKLKLNLEWSKLDIYLEDFLGGGQFSTVLQKIVPKIGKNAFTVFKPKILNLLNDALTKLVNKELQKPKVKEIIDGILGTIV